MSAIIPAILPSSREDLAEKLLRLQKLVDEVQIDIVDGTVGGKPSWPYSHGLSSVAEEELLPHLGNLRFEVDLMVENPEEAMHSWIQAGATRITVHAETAHNLPHVVQTIKTQYGHDRAFAQNLLSFGLALHVATDTALIEPYLNECDFVQFMGIARIGRQGEPFESRVIPKIRAFHASHPDMLIQIDGGVSITTAPQILQAGASRLVVGSALWKEPNIEAALLEFRALFEEYGLYT